MGNLLALILTQILLNTEKIIKFSSHLFNNFFFEYQITHGLLQQPMSNSNSCY